ncbi:MinD/ParA family protein [Symbiobacterium thermophilum]|uniref:Flagellar biosynthesis switch protein n=1 Tax=Symbiobacterium thermophilum (strain DSM 24528 / JCM 14929 / IAM 14863 / T) TaxID=292459 RepID=Q67K30_SYMTH|nr:MinD/ParA family protein [Symbiobacterium thermophilum]BAD41968.1 flagellar biosynthesis switch protein [Symbiobacterium thermophilum IAM 14863]
MFDQASRLRELAAAYRNQAAGRAPRRFEAIAVTSGKGGVGKTNLAVNLAQVLVKDGHEVLLMDVDLGLANANILLGTVPPYHLGHFLRGEVDILQVIHRTDTGLKLIAGGSGLVELGSLTAAQLRPILRSLERLEGEAEYLILDTGAGVGDAVLEFALAADQVLVVTTPEPTAMADAYTMIKALVARDPGARIRLVVNQAERPEDAQRAAERIVTTARNFLGVEVVHLGTVPRDPHVWQSVRRRVPYVLGYPASPAARAVEAMASRLVGAQVPAPSAPGSFFGRLASLFGRRSSSL